MNKTGTDDHEHSPKQEHENKIRCSISKRPILEDLAMSISEYDVKQEIKAQRAKITKGSK